MFQRRGYRRSFWTQRFGRRQLLQSAAVGTSGLAAAALIGCKDEAVVPNERTSTSGATPDPGGTLLRPTAAGGTGNVGFDPAKLALANASGNTLWYQPLIWADPRTFTLTPLVAEKWEQPSQLEYVLTLRQGVKWHNKPPVNGRELTAEDVVTSLRRVKAGGPGIAAKSLLDGVEKFEVAGEATVKITTKTPDAVTAFKLSSPSLALLPPEALEKFDKFATAEEAIGTGPFVLNSVETEVVSETVRNPDYWNREVPYLDGLTQRNFQDSQTEMAAFLAGQTHIASIPGNEAQSYIRSKGSNYTPDWEKSSGQIVLESNTNVEPFRDPRVFKALRLLIDHQEFGSAWAETSFGGGQIISIFPDALEKWDLSQEEYQRYLEWRPQKDEAAREALKLLDAAGFNKSNSLKIELLSRGPGGDVVTIGSELLQAQWRRLSQGVVDVSLKVESYANTLSLMTAREFTISHWNEAASIVEPDAWLKEKYYTGASRAYHGYSDARLDQMVDKQSQIFNEQERIAAVKEIVSYLIENGPTTSVYGRWYLKDALPQVRNYRGDTYLNGYQYERVWLDG